MAHPMLCVRTYVVAIEGGLHELGDLGEDGLLARGRGKALVETVSAVPCMGAWVDWLG